MNKKDQKKAKGKAVSKLKDLRPKSAANVRGGGIIAVGDSVAVTKPIPHK